ncbi:hypothetical protein CEXT_56851 [Caerostris extrusa]|uniref:Uncharacterized protein n=1 Tax=Caerostris extrusa TaxID=172846 RepID=A0AAV4TV62_CAEEX|nr:hypothetical protein CEXT_56851 [Caerostris extrusa]
MKISSPSSMIYNCLGQTSQISECRSPPSRRADIFHGGHFVSPLSSRGIHHLNPFILPVIWDRERQETEGGRVSCVMAANGQGVTPSDPEASPTLPGVIQLSSFG